MCGRGPVKPEEIENGSTVELETTTGWTRGLVLKNHVEDRWLRLHDGTACDDVEYSEITAVKVVAAGAIVRQVEQRHSAHPLRGESTFEANQGRGWGKK